MIKVPKNEIVKVSYYNSKHVIIFILTENLVQRSYFLYSVDGNTLTKLGKSQDPVYLETKYKVKDKMFEE